MLKKVHAEHELEHTKREKKVASAIALKHWYEIWKKKKQIFMMQLNLKYVYVVRFNNRAHIHALKLIFVVALESRSSSSSAAAAGNKQQMAMTSLWTAQKKLQIWQKNTHRERSQRARFASVSPIGIAIDNEIIYALRYLIYSIKIHNQYQDT